jgi:RNA recognition motif-containing protein
MSSREEGDRQQDVSPVGFYRRLQSTVSKAAQIASTGATIKDGEGLDALSELLALLSEKLELSHLTQQEALLRSVLLVVETRYNSSQITYDAYSELIQQHGKMTFNCNASAVNITAFLSYVNILLALHYTYEETQPTQNELALVDISDEQGRDIIAEWTGFQGGPITFPSGRYNLDSLQLGISRSAAKKDQTQPIDQWEALLDVEATRVRLREAYSRISGDIIQSQQVWSLYHQFEITHLPASPSPQDLELMQSLYIARLRAPHAQLDSTLSSYSTFVTRYLPSKDYEGAMTSVYKIAANAKETWAACEPHESQLASQIKSHGSSAQSRWAAWKGYISWISHSLLHANQKRNSAKLHLDLEGVCAMFERAIASCGLPSSCSDEMLSAGGKPLTQGELGSVRATHQGKKEDKAVRKEREQQEISAEREAGVDLWKRYLNLLNAAKASSALTSDICTRASRAIPSSGVLHAHILRTFCRLRRDKAVIDEHFVNALGQVDTIPTPASMIEFVVAWIDVQRGLAAGSVLLRGEVSDLSEAVSLLPRDSEAFMEVYSMMTFALNTLEERGILDGDLRVEQLVSEWCVQGGDEVAALAEDIWSKVILVQPGNSLAWQYASRYYQRRGISKKARGLLMQALKRKDMASDKKVLIAEELVKQEHIFGGVSEIEWALDKLDSEREKSWVEYYATYSASQDQQAYPVEAAPEVQMTDGTTTGDKRKAQDDEVRQSVAIASNSRIEKRGREGDVKPTRDRENSSVLVDMLPSDATTDDVLALFADCGEIREITGPKVVESEQGEALAAAIVEFTSRESIPAARSRQLKAVRSSQVNISMGWECTLYVTNFSPEYDSDERIRQLFGPFGRMFDVRWPSKKFANSRRFCYIQYCSAQSARSALSLDQMEMIIGETGETIKMQVALSDPNRKKVRSDAQSIEREMFLSGLPRGVSEVELASLFGDEVESVRIPKHPDGRNKGIAFVDMKTALDAQTALGRANQVEGGLRIKGKLITVTAAEKTKGTSGSSAAPGLDRKDCRVRVRGLPLDAQEAIIQQIFEAQVGMGGVRRVDWTPGEAGRGVATVEFQDVATAGRVALMSSIQYDEDHPLELSAIEGRGTAAPLPSTSTTAAFAPRQAVRGRGGRGRGGIGFARRGPPVGAAFAASSPPQESAPSQTPMQVDSNGTSSVKKTPDSFREMLKKG